MLFNSSGKQVVCGCVCMYNLGIHVCKTFARRVGVRVRMRSEGEE